MLPSLSQVKIIKKVMAGEIRTAKQVVTSNQLELRNDPLCAGMSLEKFKGELLKAHEAGLVALREAKARSVLDSEELRESEVRDLKGTFHFIESRSVE
jgi:hypothetical protein